MVAFAESLYMDVHRRRFSEPKRRKMRKKMDSSQKINETEDVSSGSSDDSTGPREEYYNEAEATSIHTSDVQKADPSKPSTPLKHSSAELTPVHMPHIHQHF